MAGLGQPSWLGRLQPYLLPRTKYRSKAGEKPLWLPLSGLSTWLVRRPG